MRFLYFFGLCYAAPSFILVFHLNLYYSATWSALGDAHLHMNNLKTALNCYSKAASLERETLYSLARQAFAMTLLGRYNQAISLYEKVIDQSPKYILARKGLHNFFFFNFMIDCSFSFPYF